MATSDEDSNKMNNENTINDQEKVTNTTNSMPIDIEMDYDDDKEKEEEEEIRVNKDDHLLMNDTEEYSMKHPFKPSKEQNLSQKISQLSTTDQQTTEVDTIVNKDLETHIPYYLSKANKSSFEQIIDQASSSSSDMIEELRQMAILIYQLALTDLQKSLWLTYFKSGTGKLKSNQNDHDIGPQIWPPEVQSLIKKSTKENDHIVCLTYVTQHLCELDNKMQHYQTELNTKKNQWSDYIEKIQTFVQQGFQSTRLEIEHQIALVQYNYIDRVLEFEYLQCHPTSYQKQLAKNLCHAKYYEEVTKEEFNLLKQRISLYQSSSSSFQLGQETFFNTIDNHDRQERLHQQYLNVAQEAKEQMIQLYLSSAEAQMHRYHQQFTNTLELFQSQQHSLPKDQQLSTTMKNLIEQRYQHVNTVIQCIYKYRSDLMHLNSIHHQ